jgi:hypothetical protein
MADHNLPRYLKADQAGYVRQQIDGAILAIRASLEAGGADRRVFDHEIGMALARAACRLDLDLLQGASSTIERLEAVVAEMGAKLEQAKIASDDDAKVPRCTCPNCRQR